MTRRITLILLVAAAVGVVGGYGVGELTDADRGGGSGPAPSISGTGGTEPTAVKTPVPDRTKALRSGDIVYQARTFDAQQAVRSRVRVQVPSGWHFTQPVKGEGRYTDPTRKRWIRVEAGFTPSRRPADAMHQRIDELGAIDPAQDLQIVDTRSASAQHVDGTSITYSTLSYTYVPQTVRRQVVVRWVSFGEDGHASVEMSVTGLPQDGDALLTMLQRATRTVDRSDGPR